MVRNIDVIRHDREYAPGKHTTVRHHKRKIADTLYDPLPDAAVERLSAEHLMKTSPDYMATSRITFLKGNEIWAMSPDKYDVLNYDASNVPEYDKVPERARPNQIIRVGAKYYLGNKNGHFERTFPPRINMSRYAKFKEEYLKTHEFIPYKGAIWEAYRKKVMGEKPTLVSRENWEKMKAQQGLRTYPASRNAIRNARKARKDLALTAMPGWHTIRTTGYGIGPGTRKKGGFAFTTDDKNYYTWPGKKEREKMIKRGDLKA